MDDLVANSVPAHLARRHPWNSRLLGALIGGYHTAGARGLASMLNFDRDRNAIDDNIGMACRYLR